MNTTKTLKQLGISLAYIYDIEAHGFYMPENNTIYINNHLVGIERENALLHELGHFINEHDSTSYASPARHIKTIFLQQKKLEYSRIF
ncbi:TPA: ImmA/IrrE family metallo-endopeptidase [Enterococcus faecalis]|nr:ImmA/IrrE family metallo-endopeptidase [Enterococcus faecalis]